MELRLRAHDGGRCRPGSLALGVGQRFVICTLCVAISVVPAFRTAQQIGGEGRSRKDCHCGAAVGGEGLEAGGPVSSQAKLNSDFQGVSVGQGSEEAKTLWMVLANCILLIVKWSGL